jgi:predicted AAA+ superfamily ATPase
MSDRPVVLLHGARQTGKTTLAKSVKEGARYLTLDDAATFAAATTDAQSFIDGLKGPSVLDEVQRAPTLFPAIKRAVDEQRSPGRFLLTGSANVLVLPRLSESLAGRMEVIALHPLTQGEVEGRREGFIDAAFSRELELNGAKPMPNAELREIMLRGGFPEVATSISPSRRDAWFGSYLTTILQRDVRDLSNIEDLTLLPRLLSLLASRSAGLLNFADLSRGLSVPQTTLKRYFSLLEALFLVRLSPPWFVNVASRLVKTPKVFVTDSGLMGHLLGLGSDRLGHGTGAAGSLLESFVVNELVRQTGWSERKPSIHHFRTHSGHEVDIVLEDRSGDVVGIEVRSGSTIGAGDFDGLRVLAEAAGKRFVRGILLYGGGEILSFARNMAAAPISALWRT